MTMPREFRCSPEERATEAGMRRCGLALAGRKCLLRRSSALQPCRKREREREGERERGRERERKREGERERESQRERGSEREREREIDREREADADTDIYR
jgi:hypothetical protein